jgi:hypothetical protein
MTERSRRDLALDLLRGYFLFVILVDHLRFAVNPLYYLSGRMSLWVSAAEGFVLVSGFLVGKLRGGQARARGLPAATRHLLHRAAVLAICCAILTIGYRVISETLGYWPEVPNADEPGSLRDWILGALVLRKTYGDHNLLAVYALFMLVAPLGLHAMMRGRTLFFLAASGLVWAASFRYWLRWSSSVQADASWQLLFALGMAAGFHEERLAACWAALSARARRAIVGAGAVLTVAILAASVVRLQVPPEAQSQLEVALFHRERLGPGRIACALVVVATMYACARIFEDRLARTAGRIFVPLGQHSLYVYILQSMLTFCLVDRAMTDPWLALATSLSALALLWVFVQNRVLFGIIPR